MGGIVAAIITAAAIAAALWLAFGLTDALAGFEIRPRLILTFILAAACAIVLLVSLVKAFRITSKQTAASADDALGDPRRPASAALSLDPAAAPTPLAALLTTRTLESVTQSLAALPAKRVIPWNKVRRACTLLAVPLVITAVLKLSAPAAFSAIAARLLHPTADIPPYSALRFKIDPEKPSTVYGGEITLTAEITGEEIKSPVECLLRKSRDGEILRLPAFRESPTRFSRKLDGLTEPVEIAFASGRARSVWLPVDILLQPNILSGVVRLTPPAYTGLAPSSFPLDTNEIAAIEGTSVTLELTSNRPLASGSLAFTPASAPGTTPSPETVSGSVSTTHTAAFTWTATRTGRVSAIVRDLRGTPSPQPLELAFRALPDLPPAVDLTSPPRMILATPLSVVPVQAQATDDFALSRLQLVRTLTGFRDRIRMVAPALRDKSYDFTDRIDLAVLGVQPGQTVEVMLEASDHNPSLLGQGSSEISRIRIISEEDYAEYLRNKTTIEEFGARFRAVHESVENARQALEELRKAATPEAIEKARADHREAVELLEKIARDFPAFELEKRLQDLAGKQTADLRENLADLENFDEKNLDRMIERLGRRQQQAQELAKDTDVIKQAAALLEMAARFKQIYDTQVSLTKRFNTILDELRHGQDQNRRMLPSLGETQRKNREALDKFAIDLRERADALRDHPQLGEFATAALEFVQELEAAAPQTLMDAATKHAKAGQTSDAYTNAELARALLERLMSQPNPFAQACQGKAPGFNLPNPDANATIEQLLKALMNRNPGGGAGSTPNQNLGQGGMGAGGFGDSGAAMDGYSMQLPVIGPDRLQFEPTGGPSKGGDGKSAGKDHKPLPTTAEAGRLKSTETRQGESPSIAPESVPEPYREAVKRYFTP